MTLHKACDFKKINPEQAGRISAYIAHFFYGKYYGLHRKILY